MNKKNKKKTPTIKYYRKKCPKKRPSVVSLTIYRVGQDRGIPKMTKLIQNNVYCALKMAVERDAVLCSAGVKEGLYKNLNVCEGTH